MEEEAWGITRQARLDWLKLNATEYHWSCTHKDNMWAINRGGKKLALICLVSIAYPDEKRGPLRKVYANFTKHFDLLFAVGYPKLLGDGGKSAVVCDEQAKHGDLLMLNKQENMNDGKAYFILTALSSLLNGIWKGSYQHVIKLDDDTYVHLPRLYTWMTETRGEELNSSEAVLFGGEILGMENHYFSGALQGYSADLYASVWDKIEYKWSAGMLEDWLTGFWMAIYGPDTIRKVKMDSGPEEKWKHLVNLNPALSMEEMIPLVMRINNALCCSR
eukprot:gene20824-27652_t